MNWRSFGFGAGSTAFAMVMVLSFQNMVPVNQAALALDGPAPIDAMFGDISGDGMVNVLDFVVLRKVIEKTYPNDSELCRGRGPLACADWNRNLRIDEGDLNALAKLVTPKLGDVNADGLVTGADADLILKALARLEDGSTLCGGLGITFCGDLSGDGKVTSWDSVILRRVLSADVGDVNRDKKADARDAMILTKVLAPKLGDLNNDGKITKEDPELILKALIQSVDGSTLCGGFGIESCGDLDNNGYITTSDASMIMKIFPSTIPTKQ